ncbi:efflux RND transporter permease subunit [Bacillus sp. V5-8f]|uniref:efflux RND transporter permease subunit n=1 Tax=Bacillus sp. V5-8f TaxID=2053044 RepID=UPI000C78E5F4|nr:efflux RND transporter permease subunit [Bacillus sp. V5-8f]PLT33434.1 Swarming motility protein SwrC [Bacillus sp. V5-8f]
MDKIINFTLKNKLAVWLITIIVVVAGLYSGLRMKLESIPDINIPMLNITTVYPGATPDEVNEKVSQPIEQAVSNLNLVKVVSSTSYQNASSVQIEFEYEVDMDEAKNEVEEALSDLDLPEGVQNSDIQKININAFPILALSVANEKESLAALTNTVEDEIAPALEGIEGVSNVQISGQQLEEVQLTFNEKKMQELGLNEESVKGIIQGSDVTVPLGLFTFKDTEKSVQIDGNVTTIEDLKNLEIPLIPSTGAANAQSPAGGATSQAPAGTPGMHSAAQSGQTPTAGQGQAPDQQSQGQASANAQSEQTPATGQDQVPAGTPAQGQAPANVQLPTIKLSEIASIKEVGKTESVSRTNGKESIGLSIVKASDANTVDVAERVNEAVQEFEKDIDGLEVVTSFDQATPIKESVNTMLSKAIIGAVFAMIIILLFLRDIKSTIISVISIPLSLLIAILLLNQMDITLNMMTLGAMTVAIGRVIDDSIVVIENIYRRMSLKDEPLKGGDLIREATKEMFIPILSSTVVTVAVFLPLGLVGGMVGELFMPFALTIVFALAASLFVAITIVPMLAHSMFKKGMKAKTHEKGPGRLALGYKRVLNWTLNHKIITSGIAVLMLVGSLALIPAIGVSFLPEEEQKMMITTFNPNPGVTDEQAEDVVSSAEKFYLDRENVKTVQLSLGAENPMMPGDTNSAMFFVEYDSDTENFEKEKEDVIKELQAFTDIGEWRSQDFSQSGASNQIQVQVFGENMKDIEPVAKELEDILKDNKNLTKVDSSIAESYDEYKFVADQKKLSELGLTAGQVAMALAPERERPVLTPVEKDGEDLNVYVQVETESIDSVDDLTNKTVQSPLGNSIKIEDVVDVQEGTTSDTVTRRDGKIYVSVSGELTTDDVAKVSADLQEKIDKLDPPSGVDVSMGGVTEDIQESFTQLGLAMLAAIAIVYLVLVITFAGGLAPFAILFSLPFTVIGALLGLLIAGETLSLSAMIGALMLIGIVVTNAIVLIDRVIHKENEGMTTREALLDAGVTRLRPILMTAIATIGALIPLALGLEGSGIISKGLGVTVIGGLTSSTLLTLVIVPIVYEAISKLRRKSRKQPKEA